MSLTVLTRLFHYHRWANLELAALCATLTDEQLDAELLGTFGSIRNTLSHIAKSDRSYITRVMTGQPYRSEGVLSPAEAAASLQTTGDQLIEWAERVQPAETVEIDWDGVMRDVPKTVLLTQAIHHATEHRTQILSILAHLGVATPDLSGWEHFGAEG